MLKWGISHLITATVVLLGVIHWNSTSYASQPPSMASPLADPSPYVLYFPVIQKASSPIQAPVLKWQNAGCYSSWCETGWYASPAVADLDDDGSSEVIGAMYSVFILDGADGTLVRRIDPAGDRSWPSVVVADRGKPPKIF
ncbi:MAG: hypothetical protein A2Z14_03480 [Chloroflexi bacterium RBG_16_48_8]|nr:MAG: hypothetical protein A2Z14_03480 [Chloroflexi bacterium RBG_16_48_8]